jgi:hypothetical protein
LSRYRVVRLIDPDRIYARARAPYGRAPLALVATRPLLHVVRVDRTLVERVVAPSTVELPVQRGDRLGWVQVYDRGRLIGTRQLVAARSIERPGLQDRIAWYARRTWHHLADLIT